MRADFSQVLIDKINQDLIEKGIEKAQMNAETMSKALNLELENVLSSSIFQQNMSAEFQRVQLQFGCLSNEY